MSAAQIFPALYTVDNHPVWRFPLLLDSIQYIYITDALLSSVQSVCFFVSSNFVIFYGGKRGGKVLVKVTVYLVPRL